mgnify:CR=1 FL=1
MCAVVFPCLWTQSRSCCCARIHVDVNILHVHCAKHNPTTKARLITSPFTNGSLPLSLLLSIFIDDLCVIFCR